MLQLFAYAFGIMYTPGPVNLLALNAGLQGQSHRIWGFHIGVGLGLFIPLTVLSLMGTQLVTPERLRWLTLLGCGYIIYLAWKIARANITVPTAAAQPVTRLRFRDGLLMQLLNPKGMIACLPITTLYMPTLYLSANGVVITCILLATLGAGAPAANTWAGHWVRQRLNALATTSSSGSTHTRLMKGFNLVMAVFLAYAALALLWNQWSPLWV